jgi:hypothetical protein
MDFDFTTKAGIQKFIVTLVGLVIEGLATFGVAQAKLDAISSVATIAAPIVAVVLYYIINQIAAKGKAITSQKVLETKVAMVEKLAVSAPDVAIAIAQTNPNPTVTAVIPTPANATVDPVPQVKDRIKDARKIYGTWEGAKLMLLSTFKDRFEAALKRFASVSGTTIEAARLAVFEVAGVMLDDKACERISLQPGFLGALGANLDSAKIIPDLIAAIDKTPELEYLKKSFTARAIWYAVKAIVDDAVIRIQAGEGNAASRLALQEFGYTAEQARNAQYSGGAVDGFDPWARAGVNPYTMEDL